jgi:asparagine synthase (glutamine-hydrolysing)
VSPDRPPPTPRPAGPPDPSPEPIQALPLRPLERAAGLGLGEDPDAPRPQHGRYTDPREALGDAMREALEAGPCVVSFSGGRDSSIVLAVAVTTARRHGLPDPVPMTLRLPAVQSTQESEWQELLIGHLGVSDWEVIEIGEELDLLGPIARRTLLDHGALYPPNTYLHQPMYARARGATLLTGVDGDGLLGDWRWAHAQSVLHRRISPRRTDPLRVGLALAPPVVRRRFITTRWEQAAPWLRPDAQRELVELARSRAAGEPRRWDRWIPYYRRHRYLQLTLHSLEALGRRYGVAVAHPLLDGRFLAALAADGGAAGYGGRTRAMRILFGDLLPETLIARRTKAEFGQAFWRGEARAFAQAWDGAGIDAAQVDIERLMATWRTDNPPFGAGTLLQIAWLASQRR